MLIEHIDHLVLTVRDIEVTCSFYTSVLGMKIVEFANKSKTFLLGNQKINLHAKGNEFEPHTTHPVPGYVDMCLLTSMKIEQFMTHLQQHEVEILEGPVDRTGATGALRSVYFRDPRR